MRSIADFAPEDVIPVRSEILSNQGIPEEAELTGNFERIYEEAITLYKELAEPAGVTAEISTSRFGEILRGEGLNEPANPVEEIYVKSSYLALFAVTLGAELSDRVTELFDNGDYASGYMLDSVSSCAADKFSALIAKNLQTKLADKESGPSSLRVLSYCPGYCGWHISGQIKLFEVLCPQDIGITLNDSCLMSPIKSVSGVLIAGTGEIHQFVNSYPFCDTCRTKSCIGRMRDLKKDPKREIQED